MMVSSPTPPYLPPHYGDPTLPPPYYPMQHGTGAATAATSSGGHLHHHQHHMPIHSTQTLQPIPTSGQPYLQPPPPYYSIPPVYPPAPPVPTNTGATPATTVAAGVGAITGGVTGDNNNAMGGTRTGGGGAADQLVQQDIERGLRIDFYSETDPMLLASWASFFRDQFIEVRQELAKASFDRNAETYRRATHFVERVETKILKTNPMKLLFRRHPMTHINDPIFVDACYRVIIDYLMRNPPFDGFAFGNPTWRDYMWFRAGLVKVVEEGRNEFLEWYTKKIWETLESYMPVQKTDTKWGKIIEASQLGMKSEASYNEAKRFYVRFFDDVLSKIEQPQPHEGGGGVLTVSGVLPGGSPSSIILGKRVREVFHLDDEAFILSAIRFYHSNHDNHTLVPKSTEEGEGPHPEGKPPKVPQDAGTGLPLIGGVTEGEGFLQILANALEMSHVLATQESTYPIDAPIFILNETATTMGENDVVMSTIMTTMSSSIHHQSPPQQDDDETEDRGATTTTSSSRTTTGSS